MKSAVNSMTEGPLAKKMLTFSLPLILSNVLQVLFNMSDIAVVGRFAGAEPLGSVGSTSTLVALFVGFLIGLGSGVNVLVARYLGAGKDEEVRESVHTSFIVCLITGCLLLVIGNVSARGLLELLHTKEVLIDGAQLYLNIYFLGMPATAVYNFGNGVLSAAGDTKKPLYILTAAGVINILLNLFFVIVCGLSVAGVAMASAISQYIAAVTVTIVLWRSEECYRLRLSELRPEPGKCRMILNLGIPAGFQYAIFQIANLFIQSSVNSFDAVMVEGNSAALNADALAYDVMGAFYTAGATFIGQNYGAGKKDRIWKSYVLSLVYSVGSGAVIGWLLVLFGRQFLGLFTTEAAVVEAGMTRLTIMGLSYGISGFMDGTMAASRGLGKTVVPMIIVIMGSCVLRVIWVYTIFAYFHTILSLYLLYIFSWTATAIAEIVYFLHIFRRLPQRV